jgi:hypothetical protein
VLGAEFVSDSVLVLEGELVSDLGCGLLVDSVPVFSAELGSDLGCGLFVEPVIASGSASAWGSPSSPVGESVTGAGGIGSTTGGLGCTTGGTSSTGSQPSFTIVLLLKVMAAVFEKSGPENFAPSPAVIASLAITTPTNVELAPKVAAAPNRQNTLQACAPFIN